MARLPNCKICGNPITSEEKAIPYKNGKVHEHCFNSMMKMAGTHNSEKNDLKNSKSTTRKSSTIRSPVSEQDYEDKKLYFQTYESIAHKKPDAKIYKISEDYINKYGFSYTGMRLSLVYEYEIKGSIPKDSIIWIIPYIYTEAQNDFQELERIHAYNNNVDDTNYYGIKVIRINPHKEADKCHLIDMEKLN